MAKRGSGFGFFLTLLGGIANMIVAINLLSPFPLRQAAAAYFAVFGTLLLTFSFRLRRPHHLKSGSLNVLILSVLSLNPISLIGGFFGLAAAYRQGPPPAPEPISIPRPLARPTTTVQMHHARQQHGHAGHGTHHQRRR